MLILCSIQAKKQKAKRKHVAILDELKEIEFSEFDSDCPKQKKKRELIDVSYNSILST